MDPATPVGFLAAFILLGILLPIAASFILDGIVHIVRGRGIRLLAIATAITVAILIGGILSLKSGAAVAANAPSWNKTPDTLSGAIPLVLIIVSVGSLIGFAVRLVTLRLNPKRRAREAAAVKARADRKAARRGVSAAISH